MVRVEVKESGIHGLGLFAVEDIPQGTRIIEYAGEKISGEEGDRRSIEEENEYIMSLDEEFDIDGKDDGNIAKYLNHSCDFNTEVIVEDGRIWYIAEKDIKKGEELTTDYEMDCHELIPCHCKTNDCRTYLNHPEDIPTLMQEAETAEIAEPIRSA